MGESACTPGSVDPRQAGRRPSISAYRRRQALAAGLHYVYTGNIHDTAGQSTYCASCGELLIERGWYELGAWQLDERGQCRGCGARLAGRFEPKPGRWGSKRRPLVMSYEL